MITALVAIILNPISMGTGYVLNRILQKPRFSIEYISEHLFTEQGSVAPEMVSAIASNKVLNPLLRGYLTRVLPGQPEQANLKCIDWLDGATLRGDCYDQVHELAAGLLATAESENDALKENLRRIEAKTIESDGVEPMQLVRPEILALGADRMAPTLRGQLKQFEAMIPQLRVFVEALTQAQQESTATGDIEFDVGVLNSGDSDGVIKNRADLNFGTNKSVWLYTDPDAYVVVKAHSFQEITFKIGGSADRNAGLAELENIVRERKPLEYEIVLKTGSTSIRGHGNLEQIKMD